MWHWENTETPYINSCLPGDVNEDSTNNTEFGINNSRELQKTNQHKIPKKKKRNEMSLDFAIIYLASWCLRPLLQVPLCRQAFFSREDLRCCFVPKLKNNKTTKTTTTRTSARFHDSLLLNGLLHVNWSHLWLCNAFLVGVWELTIQSIIYFECFWSFLLFYWYYNIPAMSMMNIVQ